jgi:hypothetical protein
METRIRLYVRTPQKSNEFTVCNEITDEVYASTNNQELAVVIKNALEDYLNNK